MPQAGMKFIPRALKLDLPATLGGKVGGEGNNIFYPFCKAVEDTLSNRALPGTKMSRGDELTC